MTALANIYAGARIVAADVQSVAPAGAIKGSDQSVTSSTVLVNDNALLAGLQANAKYFLEMYLDYEGASGAGFLKFAWSVPSGATIRYAIIYVNTGNSVVFGAGTEASTFACYTGGAGVHEAVRMTGTIVTSVAGTLQLQWAQNASNGTATIVHAQSVMALWRMA